MANDIDILMAIRGLRQSSEGLSNFQKTLLRSQESIAKGAAVVNSMDSAFREFNQTGSVSITTLSSLASALPGLANPMAAVAAAAGATLLSFKLLKQADVEDGVFRLGLAFQEANLRLTEQQRVLNALSGESSPQMRKAIEDLVRAETALSERSALLSAKQQELIQAVKDGSITGNEATQALATYSQLLARGTERIAQNRDAALQRLEALKAQRSEIERLRAEEEKLQQQRAEQFASLQSEVQLVELESQRRADLILLNQARDEEIQNLNELNTLRLESEIPGIHAEIEGKVQLIALINEQIAAQLALADAHDFVAASAQRSIGGIGAAAFDTLALATERAVRGQQAFGAETERALKSALKSVTTSIGREAALKSAFQLAEGFGNLAIGNIPSATLNFQAAAIYGGLAVGAAAAAGALGGTSPRAATGGGSGGTPTSDRALANPGQIGGNRGGVSQFIVVIGALDDRGAEELEEKLARAREKRDLGA